MTNANTDMLATVSIANVIHSGAGFGVVIGTGANCIIPSRVLYAADLRVGDLIRCRLADNPSEEYRGRTPYMVSYVDPNATADLRRAITGGKTPHQAAAVAAQPTEQLNLPFEEPLKELLAAWGDDDDEEVTPAPAPAPVAAPTRETSANVREWVEIVLDSGGMWTLGQIRDYIWPNDDFGSDDYRYKLLTNVMRDLHASGAVAAVGRRNSMRGLLTGIHYTKQPQKVRFVWED
jgi:hypothetical protein